MLTRILTAIIVTGGVALSVSAPLADTASPGGAAGPRIVLPPAAPSFGLSPRPTQGPTGQLTFDPRLFGDQQVCCDANDNCTPLNPPAVCPHGTITSWCDADNNCVDEE